MWWNMASSFEFEVKSMEMETTTWSEFPSGEKAIFEEILVPTGRNKSNRAGPWES